MDSGTTMAGKNVTQVNGVDDMHRNVARKNQNDANRVEDDTISVSVGDYHLGDDGRRNRSNEQMHDAENRTPLGTRAQSPRSPDMPFLEHDECVSSDRNARNTFAFASAVSGQCLFACSESNQRTITHSQVNLDLLSSVMHRVVDDANYMRQEFTDRNHQLTTQNLMLVQEAANKHAEAEILRKEKEWIVQRAELEMCVVKMLEEKEFSAKKKEMLKTQPELANQRENKLQEIIQQREELAKQCEDKLQELSQEREDKQLELAQQRENKQQEREEMAIQREDKLRNDLYQFADLKAKAAVLEQHVRDYNTHKRMA